jgi:hypothetical protein
VVEHVTFNHGVEGSSPSALTNQTGHFSNNPILQQTARVCTVSANELPRWLRRALAFPLYAGAVLLLILGSLLGLLAFKIDDDPWLP